MRLVIGIISAASLLFCIGALILLVIGNNKAALISLAIGLIMMIAGWLASNLINQHDKTKKSKQKLETILEEDLIPRISQVFSIQCSTFKINTISRFF